MRETDNPRQPRDAERRSGRTVQLVDGRDGGPIVNSPGLHAVRRRASATKTKVMARLDVEPELSDVVEVCQAWEVVSLVHTVFDSITKLQCLYFLPIAPM